MDLRLRRGGKMALALVLTVLLAGTTIPLAGAETANVLPKPAPPFKGKIGTTYKDSQQDYPQPVKPPAGAPNIVVILLDDVGFGQTGTFGGPVPTPHLDKLASQGLALQPVSHHGHLLADPGSAPDRPQSPSGRHRDDHRTVHRFSRVQQFVAPGMRQRRRSVEAERLQHRGLGEMAQHA